MGASLAGELTAEPFDPCSFLQEIHASQCVAYLRSYLSDLQATTVVAERHYFDQDHLDAVSGYYSLCARSYPNFCTRLHVFRCEVTRDDIFVAASGHDGQEAMHRRLQEHYLGFIVIRPLVPPLLGRTVLTEYPNASRAGMGLRESDCARMYDAHLAGVHLRVKGLAWQQQDRAVSSCAIVSLWSTFHAFDTDEARNIPTTTDIARRIHGLSWRSRVQPTPGLSNNEVAQIIRAFDFTPFVIEGDERQFTGQRSAFSLERFSGICACLLRSGFPVLMACTRQRRVGGKTEISGRHAICSTGFRLGIRKTGSSFELGDKALQYLYAHDDNWGPSVRFRVRQSKTKNRQHVFLELEPPPARNGNGNDDDDARTLARDYDTLVPTTLIVAVPSRMRVSPDTLYAEAFNFLRRFANVVTKLSPNDTVDLSTRYMGVREYMRDELPRVTARLHGDGLARIRLALTEQVAPLSLYLGLVRFGLRSSGVLTPLFDVLYDTTEGERAMRAMATVAFSDEMRRLLEFSTTGVELGHLVGP